MFIPHSAYEIHSFAFSYCRSVSFHESLGEIRASICLIGSGICFALVRYHSNLRSTHLGLAEPKVEEGSCLIVGPFFRNGMLKMGVSCPWICHVLSGIIENPPAFSNTNNSY